MGHSTPYYVQMNWVCSAQSGHTCSTDATAPTPPHFKTGHAEVQCLSCHGRDKVQSESELQTLHGSYKICGREAPCHALPFFM